MILGSPEGLSWYTFVYRWQMLIASLIVLFAALIVYFGTLRQVMVLKRAVQNRKWAYAGLASIEALRIEADAKQQIESIASLAAADPARLDELLAPIEVRDVLRATWEPCSLPTLDALGAVFRLADAVDAFNARRATLSASGLVEIKETLAAIASRAAEAHLIFSRILNSP